MSFRIKQILTDFMHDIFQITYSSVPLLFVLNKVTGEKKISNRVEW